MYRARKVAATRIRHILAALGVEIRPRGSNPRGHRPDKFLRR
jgi:hypothetical protein